MFSRLTNKLSGMMIGAVAVLAVVGAGAAMASQTHVGPFANSSHTAAMMAIMASKRHLRRAAPQGLVTTVAGIMAEEIAQETIAQDDRVGEMVAPH